MNNFIKTAIDRYGQIDVLLNHTGIYAPGTFATKEGLISPNKPASYITGHAWPVDGGWTMS